MTVLCFKITVMSDKMTVLSDKMTDHKILTDKMRNWQSEQVILSEKTMHCFFNVGNLLNYFDGRLWGG